MPPRQVLTRTLGAIHVGSQRAMEKKRRQDEEYDLREIELQYQLPIDGEAGVLLAWTPEPVRIAFEWGFHYAPMQRDSELELPHFTYGAYLVSETPVGISACVSGWEEDEANGAITAALVSVGAHGGTGEPIPFRAFLHATFQGFATSLDETSENPELEIGI